MHALDTATMTWRQVAATGKDGAAMPAPGQYNPALPGHSHAYHDDLLPSAAFRSGAPSRSGATQVRRHLAP